MKTSIKLLLLLIIIVINFSTAQHTKAEIVGGLTNDTVSLKLYGWPISTAPGLNIKLKFTNPEVAKLDSKSPDFKASGVTKLLTSADPNTNIISIVRTEGIIPDNEATVTFMLTPRAVMGSTNILVEYVEAAGGFDITDTIVTTIDKPLIFNTKGEVITDLGRFNLIDPERLIGPGNAAIAFEAINAPNNLTASLNGTPVEFLEDNIGVAVVDLPKEGGNKTLALNLSTGNISRTIHLGTININPGTPIGLPPRLKSAIALNEPGNTKFKVIGRKFGVRRFEKEDIAVQIVPTDRTTTNNKLRRRSTKERLTENSCIPQGSYVNISHPAGTGAVKINVIGDCTD